MERKYTVKELESIINLSHTAIRNRIKEGQFRAITEKFNKRETTFVLLNDDEWDALIREVGLRNNFIQDEQSLMKVEQTFNKVEQGLTQDEAIELKFNKVPEIQINHNELVLKVLEHTDKYTERLDNLYKDLLNAQLQTKLLEDSEKRKEDGYLKQIAELNSAVAKLTEELNKLKQEKDTLNQRIIEFESENDKSELNKPKKRWKLPWEKQ